VSYDDIQYSPGTANLPGKYGDFLDELMKKRNATTTSSKQTDDKKVLRREALAFGPKIVALGIRVFD
jgi:hypothetical protein